MNKIKRATLEVQVYRYDSKEQQAAHIPEMAAQGYAVKFMGEYFTGKSNLNELMNPDNWSLVTEFYKAEVSGSVELNYEIQSRVY